MWGAIAGAALGVGAQAWQDNQNRKEAARNRRFQERMRNTQWQAAVEDMTAAGINPALAYSQGPNASPGGSQAAPHGNLVSSAMQAARFQTELRQLKKQNTLIDAQVEKAKAEAGISEVAKQWQEARWRWMTNASGGRLNATPPINEMFLAEMEEAIGRAQSVRGQAQMYEATGSVANALQNAFLNPFTSVTSGAGRGLNMIGKVPEAVGAQWRRFQAFMELINQKAHSAGFRPRR